MANVVTSNELKKFWNGKKVLVTGHTGFKGSWLTLWLHSLGAKVTGYALAPNTNPSLFEAAKISDLAENHISDIRNLKDLLKVFAQARPEIVIHMAAQPLVRYSYTEPVETFEVNVMGTVHVLEAIRQTDSVKAMVSVTTDKCYLNREWFWPYRENEALGGHDPYSSSKACAEIVTAAYRSSFFSDPQLSSVAVGSARAGNVIGGGDWSDDRLIPDIMKAIVKGESVLIRRPDAIRPWQHVLEPLSGYLILAQRLYEGDASAREAFNFGPQLQDCKNVDWVTKKLVEKWGQGAKYEMKKSPNDPHEATFLRLDCTKAIEVLGWKPQWSLDEALERIVQWNRSFQTDMANTRNLCLREIDDYMKSLNQA